MFLPKARNENIVVQEAGDELLIYDLKINKAYCLNETSAIVFQSCDGSTTFEALKEKHQFSDDLINLALDELRREKLIVGKTDNYFGGLSRRQVIKRVGLASLVALPFITGLAAPTSAQAQSQAVNQCMQFSCSDFSAACNGASGCAAIGFVCCAYFGTCSCIPEAFCLDDVMGQICPGIPA